MRCILGQGKSCPLAEMERDKLQQWTAAHAGLCGTVEWADDVGLDLTKNLL